MAVEPISPLLRRGSGEYREDGRASPLLLGQPGLARSLLPTSINDAAVALDRSRSIETGAVPELTPRDRARAFASGRASTSAPTVACSSPEIFFVLISVEQSRLDAYLASSFSLSGKSRSFSTLPHRPREFSLASPFSWETTIGRIRANEDYGPGSNLFASHRARLHFFSMIISRLFRCREQSSTGGSETRDAS